jgi:hypothetical protein
MNYCEFYHTDSIVARQKREHWLRLPTAYSDFILVAQTAHEKKEKCVIWAFKMGS